MSGGAGGANRIISTEGKQKNLLYHTDLSFLNSNSHKSFILSHLCESNRFAIKEQTTCLQILPQTNSVCALLALVTT